ncbi:MAG: tRNA-intron lyase [Euryarchaeota archaeon]|nr:tRNA-intron lyase [Euryarchaeota archaeon]
MVAEARGHLTDDHQVVVPDQSAANRLYNKGYAGVPQRGGALRLSLVEAARLVEEERLAAYRTEEGCSETRESERLAFSDLMALGVASDPGFEIPLFAYRDLRARGYVTKHANRRRLDFLVYGRGDAPPSATPAWLAGAASERAPVGAADLFAWLDEAKDEGAELIVLVVDEEGDLTHYRVYEAAPHGEAPRPDFAPVEGRFLEDRVVVWGESAARRLREPHFLGRGLPGGVQLSLVEAAALIEEGRLRVEGFEARAREVQPDLRLRTTAYRDLRARGLWIKTGFKFGTHFRAYAKHPDEAHAPWLVHCVPNDWTTTWPELSRAVRLAHSVRKTMLFAATDPDEGTVRLVAVERFRP